MTESHNARAAASSWYALLATAWARLLHGLGLHLYRLDGHTPVEETDPLAWLQWSVSADCQVARTEVDAHRTVRTVFLGRTVRFLWEPHGQAFCFETAIFPAGQVAWQRLYATWEEAEAVRHLGLPQDGDLDVPCADCGQGALDIWDTGQTWPDTLCEACYDGRVRAGTAKPPPAQVPTDVIL